MFLLALSSPWLVTRVATQQPVYYTALLPNAHLEDHNLMGVNQGGIYPLYEAWTRFGFDQPNQRPGPQPQQSTPADLVFPFSPGTFWHITQGYNGKTHGTIYPDEQYAFDLQLAEKNAQGDYVVNEAKTKGQPVLAAADGVVVWVREGDAQRGCVLLRHDQFTETLADSKKEYFFTMYCHMEPPLVKESEPRCHQSPVSRDGCVRVKQGAQIGLAGKAGTDIVHIHFHLFSTIDKPLGEPGRVPEQLLRLKGWVVRDSSGKENYFKDGWPDIGGTNQYGGWIVENKIVGPGPSAATSTVLVFDVSGSMDWRDASGKRKIEAARDAALLVIRMIRRENEQQGTDHQVGVVAFTNDAWTLQPLTSEIADVERAIARLEPQSGTNLAAGLIEGARQLQTVTTQDRRILILLSDGVPTVYLDGRGTSDRSELTALEQEVLDEAVPQAALASDCLYVIGFGDPDEIIDGWPSIDEDFLRQIVAATTCGGYYIAETADELANLYVQLRHESTGTLVGTWSGTVAQGDTTPPIPLDVPPNQSELHVTLNWPGSRLDLILTDPQKRTVDNTYPGATLFTDEPPVYAIVHNPIAGTWQAQVYGAEVPQGITDYNLIASTRSAPVKPTPPAVGGSVWTPVRPGGQGPIILLLTLLTAIGAALLVVAVSRRPMAPMPHRPPPPRPFGTLQVVAPGQPSRMVFLSRLPFTIGRRPGCDLVLPDPQVSRAHARISSQDGNFVLEDLGSINGTWVHGQRVQRHALRPGDEIQIGQTRLRFSPRH